jgi:general secretion pathway protein K
LRVMAALRRRGWSGPGSQSGMALVLTLAVLVIITAMVVEFAYGVFVQTSFLRNWQTSEKLSLAARSGVTLGAGLIDYASKQYSYTYPGTVDVPPASPYSTESADSFNPLVALRIEDETSKFNLNTLVQQNGELNDKSYQIFKRLLENLSLDPLLADAVADWIDRDQIARVSGSEDGAKNAPIETVDELLLIPGMDREVYDKLVPYVTTYGNGDVVNININGAKAELIMALNKDIGADMAQRVIDRRELKPFKSKGEVNSVPGFEGLLDLPITVRGDYFSIVSVAASEDGIKRSIECVIDSKGYIRYWKEM